MNSIEKNTILWVKTITEVTKMVAITCIVEDEEGEPMVLSMYNQVPNLVGLDFTEILGIAN